MTLFSNMVPIWGSGKDVNLGRHFPSEHTSHGDVSPSGKNTSLFYAQPPHPPAFVDYSRQGLGPSLYPCWCRGQLQRTGARGACGTLPGSTPAKGRAPLCWIHPSDFFFLFQLLITQKISLCQQMKILSSFYIPSQSLPQALNFLVVV